MNVEIEPCRFKEESLFSHVHRTTPQLLCSIPNWTASLDLLYGHTRTETHLWTLPTKLSVDQQRERRLKTKPCQSLDSRQPKRPKEAEGTSGNALVLSGTCLRSYQQETSLYQSFTNYLDFRISRGLSI